ncbi:hypothetical protein DEO72_LG11g1560 [Vigna unguiculata]|uniref:Uncharacterized protein n=1 Tax=Vigna unguiculata TaxID=3917 RepID=A0A4D6NRZ8_VIGUN|nr:hypothetical protein DEO72_LG11g1560 [Vigna unguiculata]
MSQDYQTRQLLLRRAIYLDPSVLATTSTLTPTTLANSSSTQGFLVFIHHLELNSRNATCLTPIPSSTQGVHSELNSRNTSKPTFKALPLPDRLAGDAFRQARTVSKNTHTADSAWWDLPRRQA